MLMLANQDVNMVGHDGAGIAGVTLLADRVGEGRRDFGLGGVVKGQERVDEHLGSTIVKVPHFAANRLDALAAVMQSSPTRR